MRTRGFTVREQPIYQVPSERGNRQDLEYVIVETDNIFLVPKEDRTFVAEKK
jgi:hypothetical protein